jgi:hypothetical protein
MNANELADLLDFDAKTLNWKAFADAATMLRQQQAEIEVLKERNQFLESFYRAVKAGS